MAWLLTVSFFAREARVEGLTYAGECHFDVVVGIDTDVDGLLEEREVASCDDRQLTDLVTINAIW